MIMNIVNVRVRVLVCVAISLVAIGYKFTKCNVAM